MPRKATIDPLASAQSDRPAGWGLPHGRSQHHYYGHGDTLSLCGRALFYGPTVVIPGKARCIPCDNRLLKARQERDNEPQD